MSGSQLYDMSLYFIVGTVVFLFFLFVVSCLHSEWSDTHTAVKFQHMIFSIDEDIVRQFPELKTIVSRCNTLWKHIKFMILLIMVLMITSAPIYVIRIVDAVGDHSYSSHWNVYSWMLSFAYLKGDLMGVLVVCVWVLTGVMHFAYMLCTFGGSGNENSAPVETRTVREGKWIERWKIRIVLIFVVYLTVSLLVNIFYILSITDQSLLPATSIIIRLGVAMYRLVSSAIIIPFLTKDMKNPVQQYLLEFRLIILNNMAIPCVVTAMTSSNCFQVCMYVCMLWSVSVICVVHVYDSTCIYIYVI